MREGSLEEKSLWYKYKTKVWTQDSEESKTIHNIMRILRSIHNTSFAYISTPVNSGKDLYERLFNNQNLSYEDILEESIAENYQRGYLFLEDLMKRVHKPLLYPADMVPIRQDWEQPHFQALWCSIISEKCSEVHMNEGWEFSNGSCEEFVHTMQLRLGTPKHKFLAFYNTKGNYDLERERMKNIKVYDYEGNVLSVSDGINALDNSLKWLKDRSFNAERLENCRALLEWTGEMIDKNFYQ